MNTDKKNQGLTIYPFRLIPFDLGHEIDDDLIQRIKYYFQYKEDSWELIDDPKGNNVLEAKNTNSNLFVHIYKDGIGIFTLMDIEEKYNRWEDYDPNNTMVNRKKAHKEILTHKHELSQLIKKTLNDLRSLFNQTRIRFSASPEWENGGLSYIMSFYFIKSDPKVVQRNNVRKKLAVLLFPYYDERKDKDFSINITDGGVNNEFVKIAQRNYEMLPYLHTCASWSNFLIIGKISDIVINEYWQLERELQHIWFYTYITDKFIEYSLKNISTSTPEKDLGHLDDILTEMIFKINKYEGIASSTMHERDFILYDALRTTSRLNLLIKSVEKKANILKDRYNWILNEKRTKADKRIQFILFLIAVISTIGAYETFTMIGMWSIIIIIVSVIFGLLLFKPFLYLRRKE